MVVTCGPVGQDHLRSYHVYRGETASLSYGYFGSCHDELDGNRADHSVTDTGRPDQATAWFYLITGEDASGSVGTLGFAVGAERSSFDRCP